LLSAAEDEVQTTAPAVVVQAAAEEDLVIRII
jgi:hypothetical protein